jgi:ATP-dependent protease HslVU (ClpYQ) peptidase subunit
MKAASTGQPYYRLAAFQELIRSLPPDQLIIAYTSATARIVTLLGSTEHEAREYVRDVVPMHEG